MNIIVSIGRLPYDLNKTNKMINKADLNHLQSIRLWTIVRIDRTGVNEREKSQRVKNSRVISAGWLAGEVVHL